MALPDHFIVHAAGKECARMSYRPCLIICLHHAQRPSCNTTSKIFAGSLQLQASPEQHPHKTKAGLQNKSRASQDATDKAAQATGQAAHASTSAPAPAAAPTATAAAPTESTNAADSQAKSAQTCQPETRDLPSIADLQCAMATAWFGDDAADHRQHAEGEHDSDDETVFDTIRRKTADLVPSFQHSRSRFQAKPLRLKLAEQVW